MTDIEKILEGVEPPGECCSHEYKHAYHVIRALCEVIKMQREAMEPWAAIQAANNPLRDALSKTDKRLAELAEGK